MTGHDPRVRLAVRGLTKRFGGITATDAVTLDIIAGETHAIIGPNGAGKTTLAATLSGELAPDSGRIYFDGRDITHLEAHQRAAAGIARSFQATSVFMEFTALDNVAVAVQAHHGHSFSLWRSARPAPAVSAIAAEKLAGVGLGARADVRAAHLSHGERRRLELAMVLAGHPKLLLLDEPTAGMGPEGTSQMIGVLRALEEQTIILIEHDMDAVFALADRISVLVYGRIIATGTPAAIRDNPDVRRAYLGDAA